MKKIISIILSIIFVLSTCTVIANAVVGDNCFNENEPNDSYDKADVIKKDYTVDGILSGIYDIDHFVFTLTSASEVVFLCACKSNNLLIGIFNTSDDVVAIAKPLYADGRCSYFIEQELPKGNYYIVMLNGEGEYDDNFYSFYFNYEEVKNHTHNYTATIVDSTCTASGYKLYSCSCGDSYKSDYTSPIGHSVITLTGVKPTCVETGLTDKKYCQTCNTVIEVQTTIPALGHTWSEWKDIPEVEGKKIRYCNTCDEFEETINGVCINHTYVETLVKATNSENGYKNYECKTCGNTYTEIINKISSIKLSSSKVTYTGKTITPTVIVTDINGTTLIKDTDYTVTYESGRKLPGVYTVTVNLKGNYEGKKTLKLTITPKTTSNIKATEKTGTSITLSWNKSTGATGYRVYQYDSSEGKYIAKKTTKKLSYKVTGLKKNTSYKFKIKPYTKMEDGTVVWGSSSDAFSAKTTKGYGVDISGTSATLYVGKTKQLKATTTPSEKTITWKSSDTSVAKVSSNGKVTAVKKGTATITAYFKYNNKTYKDTYEIIVKTPTIKLSETSATLINGNTLNLKATTMPDDMDVIWKSSNTSVATVSSSGKVTAKKAGTANITASFTYKGISYKKTCKIMVKNSNLPKDNITALAKYIKNNGYTNDYGFKFIRREYEEGSFICTFCIFYDHEDGDINFVTYLEPKDDLGINIFFSIELNGNGTSAEAEAEILYGYDYDDYLYRATTEYPFNPSQYYNQYSLFDYWKSNSFPDELDPSRLLYNTVNTSMTIWDEMIENAIGAGLTDIGFSNYT